MTIAVRTVAAIDQESADLTAKIKPGAAALEQARTTAAALEEKRRGVLIAARMARPSSRKYTRASKPSVVQISWRSVASYKPSERRPPISNSSSAARWTRCWPTSWSSVANGSR